jgi:hypothetical protein
MYDFSPTTSFPAIKADASPDFLMNARRNMGTSSVSRVRLMRWIQSHICAGSNLKQPELMQAGFIRPEGRVEIQVSCF